MRRAVSKAAARKYRDVSSLREKSSSIENKSLEGKIATSFLFAIQRARVIDTDDTNIRREEFKKTKSLESRRMEQLVGILNSV